MLNIKEKHHLEADIRGSARTRAAPATCGGGVTALGGGKPHRPRCWRLKTRQMPIVFFGGKADFPRSFTPFKGRQKNNWHWRRQSGHKAGLQGREKRRATVPTDAGRFAGLQKAVGSAAGRVRAVRGLFFKSDGLVRRDRAKGLGRGAMVVWCSRRNPRRTGRRRANKRMLGRW